MNINVRDSCGNTALHWVTKNGMLAETRVLLGSPGIDVNAVDERGYTALQQMAMSSRKVNIPVLQALLSHPDINVNALQHGNITCLHMAIHLRKIEMVRLLVARPDTNVNLPFNGEHNLHTAGVT